MKHRILIVSGVVSLMTSLGACSPNLSGDIYRPSSALTAQQVQYGTITNVRNVQIRRLQGNSDRVLGAIAGGAIGAKVGDTAGDGNPYATGAGAILGALAGNSAAQTVNRSTAQEWTIRLDNGGTIAVMQNDPYLSIGQHVRVLTDGGRTRIAS